MYVKINKTWQPLLKEEFEKEYFSKLVDFVKEEYKTQKVYPPGKEIFAAFDYCTLDNLKVVIIGQDPYHGEGQAHGLCFSVKKGVKTPPSLKNIYKELHNEFACEIPIHGELTKWAEQGVLMLNATLTVREKSPGSHQGKGWETFTDSVIELISKNQDNVVFLLWGAYAQKKAQLIDASKHHILESAHPSPFSAHRGFLGNNHFAKCNEYLLSKNKNPIDWIIE